jgi:NADH-quinone oxidoreductase subunit L
MIVYLWLVPALPMLGAVLLGLFGAALPARVNGAIGAGSVGLAAVLALCIGAGWLAHPPPRQIFIQPLWTWMVLPGFSSSVALVLDPVSLLMMLIISVIGFFIHIFSTEYMEGDFGYARYFAYLNLFVACMLLLVLASDLLVMFVGWEGVGVCSYLLVGFWFATPENGGAAQKSFIVTRIADIAMLAGLLVLALRFGTLDIRAMLAGAAAAWPVGTWMPTLAASLLLVGGLGKSAQLPLQTWLPDAMAGPTPVSALIHAATMVTAGVYLVVRLHVLFALAPVVLAAIGIGAALTVLLAAFAGLVQSDIKRVLAYSTMGQIGYMFLALGVGAWGAAMFHLLTHAVFKALLFLSAGAVSMRLNHEQNIFAMGGLRRKIPAAFAAFAIGAVCLAAIPVVDCGFFSKEFLLAALWSRSPLLWGIGIAGAFLTGLYIFRAVFTVFFGATETEITGSYGARIILPLAVLGSAALSIGWLQAPAFLGGASLFSTFLAPAIGGSPSVQPPFLVPLIGMAAPLAGVALAYALHANGFWRRQGAAAPGALRRLSQNGFGFDAAYRFLFVRPFLITVHALRHDPVDQAFGVLERLAVTLHKSLKRAQNGRLRRYAGWMMAGSLATFLLLVFA